MKNKILSLAILASSLFSMTGCLDIEPVSSTTDENMWQNEGQFTSFVYGVHSRLRDNTFNLFILGELRKLKTVMLSPRTIKTIIWDKCMV